MTTLRLRKSVVVVAALLGFATCGFAHDIKVLASRLTLAKPGKTTVYLSWGHRLPVDDLVDGTTLERYQHIGPTGSAFDLPKEGKSLQANSVELKDTGVHHLVATRVPSVFTYILDADGKRQMKRGPKSSVTEGKIDKAFRSVQCAKAIGVVGEVNEAVKPIGLPIEIVALDAPSKWTAKSDVRFQVVVNGKPVEAAELNATFIGQVPSDPPVKVVTDAKGIATLRPSQPGTWVFAVNVKRPAPEADAKEFDEESLTATLALEVR